MNRVERQIPAESIQNPQDLLKNIQVFCKSNGYRLESLEMRNDVYLISLSRPALDKECTERPNSNTVKTQLTKFWNFISNQALC
jgi:hypothetical protein